MRVLLMIVGMLAGLSMLFYDRVVGKQAMTFSEERVAAKVREMQAELPVTYKDMMRVDRIELVDRTLYYRAVLLGRWELTDAGKPKLQERLRGLYCQSDLPRLGLATEYVVHTPSHSLSDIKGETWSALVQPSHCRT